MSQHDFSIANQGFPAFRSDLNDGLQALASNSAGSSEPTTTYAYQFWYDTANDLLKMRNGDDDAWITLAAFDQATDEWEVRSAVIQAVDAGGVEIKTDDGTTRIDVADDGTVTIPGNFVVQGTVTGIDTDKISEGNSSVEVVDSGSGRIEFTTDGSERMRVDSSGNVGVAQSNPLQKLHIGAGNRLRIDRPAGDRFVDIFNDNNGPQIRFSSGDNMEIGTHSGQPVAKFNDGGDFEFDSGYGSAATAYGCRAWVNFDGTGGISIRESGNVSSITDNGTGRYTVNFATSLPDSNFSWGGNCKENTTSGGRSDRFLVGVRDPSSSGSLKVTVLNASFGEADVEEVYAQVFR